MSKQHPLPKQSLFLRHHNNVFLNTFTPRPYQIELIERALSRNTIISLNSPRNKSFIWVTYLREILGQDGRRDPDFVAVVILQSDVLVKEYGMTIQGFLDIPVAVILNNEGLPYEDTYWKTKCSMNRVIVTTSAVVLTGLSSSPSLLNRIKVLILDDCHLVVNKESDYRKIMEKFVDAEGNPYVLGLTCSLLTENKTAMQLKHEIEIMEKTLNCKAETATDLIAVDGYAASNPDEKIVVCKHQFSEANNTSVENGDSCDIHENICKDNYRDIAKLYTGIRSFLDSAISWLNSCKVSNISKAISSIDDLKCNCWNLNCSTQQDKNDLHDSRLCKCNDTEANSELSFVSEVNEIKNSCLHLLMQVRHVLDVLGLWCTRRMVHLFLKQLRVTILKQESDSQNDSVLVTNWKILILRYTDSHLRSIYTLCQIRFSNATKVEMKLVSSKVFRLLHVLKEYKPQELEVDKKQDNHTIPKYNDRSEADYVSWWQDSDAEEDEEELQMMIEGKKKEWNANESSTGKQKSIKQFQHGSTLLSGIVFVEESYTAVMLQQLLKQVSMEDPELQHISSAHITSLPFKSQNMSEQETVELNQSISSPANSKQKQEEVLRSFRSHEVNLLVSTNCLEEYADIPKCNLVLRFSIPKSYNSYILSKSRVRMSNSTFMMLVDAAEKDDFMNRLQEYKKIENVLQESTYETLPVDVHSRTDELFDVNGVYASKIAPYHSHSSSSACVTLDSAIHIVNRYCNRLPCDPFTHLTPRCKVFELPVDGSAVHYEEFPMPNIHANMYQCTLQLPLNSHIQKPVKGIPLPTVLLAQKAVALETCKILHRLGELDDHFMPIGKELVKYAEELDPWPEEKSKVAGRPGTTKRRQTYDKETPSALSQSLPCAVAPVFLYEIHMKLRRPLPNELNVRRRHLHAPEETTRCFGLLTTDPLPHVPGFQVFTRSGEESVHLRLCRGFIALGKHHIKMIRQFHHYIFSDMLRVDRVPLVFNPELAPMKIFVVILNTSENGDNGMRDLDWAFMCNVSSKQRVAERMKNDPWYRHRVLEAKNASQSFVFKRSKYEDGVVVAKYRSPDQPNREVNRSASQLIYCDQCGSCCFQVVHAWFTRTQRFYVAEIKDDLDPYSNFPSAEYESFHHYYRIKYGLDIRCLSQPLLDVDHTSSRLNLLTPRYMNQKGKALPVSSLEKKRAKYETLTNRQILVPELCDLHPVPASLWRKAVCIPSVIYRLSAIFIADELREQIMLESGIGLCKTPFGYQWPDLDFGWEDVELEKNDNSFLNTETPITNLDQNDGASTTDTSMLPNHSQPILAVGNCVSQNVPPDQFTKLREMTVDSSISSIQTTETKCKDFEDTVLFSKENQCKLRSTFPVPIPKSSLSPSVDSRESCVGPSPGLILQALTLSNASDGFNLERLEMLGDSFLKHAVTVYLFCTYPDAHEGKLSYMRSKKVSNYNLYRIGQQRGLPKKMTTLIFDPAVNWLPPGFVIGTSAEIPDSSTPTRDNSITDEVEIGVWTGVPGQKKKDTEDISKAVSQPNSPSAQYQDTQHGIDELDEEIYEDDEIQMIDNMLGGCFEGDKKLASHKTRDLSSLSGKSMQFVDRIALQKSKMKSTIKDENEFVIDTWSPLDIDGKPLSASDPLLIDLHTQHSLADKSIADCVEAILGAYLTTCGHRAAQILLCYFGLKVLPTMLQKDSSKLEYQYLSPPPNVLFEDSAETRAKLQSFALTLQPFEKKINYTFKNKAYLLQAFTHASYFYNDITDCYQRLEFLGDAILDFLITRRLFDDPSKQHSPGALTDLRSALVNNTIFASLAVRHDFHRYFKAISPELHDIIDDFVRYQQLQDDAQGMDAQLAKQYCSSANENLDDLPLVSSYNSKEDFDEEEQEDVEVPKALGDIFESVAGAIYMDSGMNLDEVWRVYEPMMTPLIKKFSLCVPRAPVRELLEMEPETAKFSWAEKRCDGKIRVTVEVIGKGTFKGVGRSYRIAKSAAARRALRFLKCTSDKNCVAESCAL